MPAQPLIDLREDDLSRTILGKDEIRTAVKQRGELEMLDGVLLLCGERKLIVGYKEIRSDDWWAPLHIPGRPLLPGALMIESAAQLCSVYYDRTQGHDERFFGFGGIDRARFRRAVEPDCRLVLACHLTRERNTLYTFEAQGFVDSEMVFEAAILGVAL